MSCHTRTRMKWLLLLVLYHGPPYKCPLVNTNRELKRKDTLHFNTFFNLIILKTMFSLLVSCLIIEMYSEVRYIHLSVFPDFHVSSNIASGPSKPPTSNMSSSFCVCLLLVWTIFSWTGLSCGNFESICGNFEEI